MKTKAIVCLAFIMLLGSAVSAESYIEGLKGKVGIGGRGPIFVPLFEGSNFDQFDEQYQPYMMGWDGSLYLRWGVTQRWFLNLGWSHTSVYDDSTATSDQGWTFRNGDNALSRLEGNMYHLTGDYYFAPTKRLSPFATIGLSLDQWQLNRRVISQEDESWSHYIWDIGLKFGVGANYWLSKNFSLDAQIRYTHLLFNVDTDVPEDVYGPGDWSTTGDRPFRGYLEPSIGLTWYFISEGDKDKDGVKDSKDDCPNTPLGAVVDERGCGIDSDSDGVYDGLDSCMNTPKGVWVDAIGCALDTDSDGVYDTYDKCPETPHGVTVDDKGCPIDTDNDGVPDYQDNCPETMEGLKVLADGCPIDGDRDGVADSVDQCLGTPVGVIVDSVGCPVAERITETITLSDNVKYASGSAELTPAAEEVLDEVVQSLRAYPETRIEIRGFTDATGPTDFNMQLSQERADAVLQYLVSQGIDVDRMTARGFGENPEYFVADNATPEGRQKNRRVEIVSVE
ncbi:OmpA family protein [candidate division GN15 bacterium]|nr:OmpA family protein [candidate division GN15 bacterium]